MLAQILWTSIASAGFQVLLTVAFALVVHVTKIWNFTQAALMGVAFYAGYVAQHQLGLSTFPAFCFAAAITIALAIGIERQAFMRLRLRQAEPLSFFIFTLVFAQFCSFALTLVFTSEPVYMAPRVSSSILVIDPIIISDWDLTSLAVAAAATLGLAVFLKTGIGQHLLAVADNPDLAEVFGVRKDRIYILVLGIAGLFIALATFVYAGKLAYYPDLGMQLMVFAVASTILAGIGRVFGAALAAVVISVMQQASVFFISSHWQPLIVYGVLFIAIVLFPKGVHWPAPRLKRAPAAPLDVEDGKAGA